MDSLLVTFNSYICGGYPLISLSKMPLCEICGMEAQEVKECIECHSMYCEECGNTKQKLCYDCLGWTDDVDEEWAEDDLN